MSAPLPAHNGDGAALVACAWRQLRAARRFHRSAWLAGAAADGVLGEGRGTVQVREYDERDEHDHHDAWPVLLQVESGHWSVAPGRPVACRNTWRWRLQRRRNRLQLAHLRHGRSHPVALVTLQPLGGRLLGIAPHRCGADRYTLEMEFINGALQMRWRICGPAKDQVLRVVYS